MESVLKALIHILLLLLPMALITTLSETTDPLCADVSPNIHECADILQSRNLPDDPPTECCNALKRIQETESRIGVQNTCQCAKSCVITHIVAAGASIKTLQDASERDISTSLQAKCGVSLGFDISENAQC